jgi:hypothetical protein
VSTRPRIHPGGIKTNIARHARIDASVQDIFGTRTAAGMISKRAFITSPEKEAHQILTAVRRDRRRAQIGPDAKAIDFVARLPAIICQSALTRGTASLRR